MKNAKKLFGTFLVIMLISVFAVSMVACDPNNGGIRGGELDNEETAFSMSIQAPDGVFNPFFSTSAYDSSIISMTQISMFNTDKEGTIIAGLDQPTVALDYLIRPCVVTREDGLGEADYSIDETNATHTDYDIVIKNGIKFSDGTPLTMKDVLFNLYVYLDPVFTGSATIYSTDIVGLSNYRMQEEDDIGEEGMNNFEQQFYTGADTYLTQLIAWIKKYGMDKNDDYSDNTAMSPEWAGHDDWKEMVSDADGKKESFWYMMDQGFGKVKVSFAELAAKVNRVASLYHDELVSDWNAINMEDYEKWPDFTQPWQVFLLNDMDRSEILKKLPGTQTLDKTEDGTYKLDVEEANSQYKSIIDEYQGGKINDMEEGTEKQNAIRDAFINSQFTSVFGDSVKEVTDSQGTFMGYDVNIPDVGGSSFEEVVTRWGTAATFMDELVATVKTNYFATSGTEQGLDVPNIRGIWVYKTDNFNGKQLNGEHYVLHIRINKVDPKALMNFAFTVAPMHYYSNPGAKDDQVKLVDEDWAAWEAAGANAEEFNTYVKHFGLKYADSDFMNNEINAKTKIVKPLGAGVYQASNDNGDTDFNKVTGSGRGTGFYDSNLIYYIRNQYFWTVGADGGSESESKLHNAYIRKAVYKVVAQDQIINALARGDILFGDPSATLENQTDLDAAGLAVVRTKTAGYGYIGINPRYVPEHQVRQAIMYAMDVQTNMIDNYYKGGFAERIYRPMSKTSWAYPKDAEPMYDIHEFDYVDENGQTKVDEEMLGARIRELVGVGRMSDGEEEGAGYTLNSNGIYEKKGKKLEFKFTIAGGSTDHPAYSCFLNAQRILNNNGFNVQVVTSAQALSDLSAGKLAVWAAAWSSAIDPDMYQVYHVNSQASSTSNWGYKQIKADKETYGYEYNIIAGEGLNGDSLSDLIDQARETNDQLRRQELYAECLDLVMSLAVEFPTYQRYDIAAYNSKYIDASSLPKHRTGREVNDVTNSDIGPYYGLLSRIWDVKYA